MFSTFIFIRSNLSKSLGRGIVGLSVLVLLFQAGILRADNTGVGVNLLPGDFESGTPGYNPWAGVDNLGNLRVWTGKQTAVDDMGHVGAQNFSPSIAVADLNGDGLPDLVVADARGFFWYYENSGRPGAPAFTQGEIMPIWLGEAPDVRGPGGAGDYVPRIQVIDYTGEKKLGIVAGTYAGELYLVHNNGSATAPEFRMPAERTSIQIPTHADGLLWCNYLAPFLYNWGGTGRFDLLMGEGSYSANSIYLFTNQGNNDHPVYSEKQRLKIIPGMGREHLTPQIVDWNNDGKADVIAGERTGHIDVYLNQNKDNSYPPTFDRDQPIHVMFGASDTFGAFSTVCVADLNQDKLFDLVLGNPDGGLYYALNTGTPGAPKFGTPTPFKGVYPYDKITLPRTWSVFHDFPYGAPDGLLQCVNAQSEPEFTPPTVPDFKGQSAMKFSIVVPDVKYFKEQYAPLPGAENFFSMRSIEYLGNVRLLANKRYTLSFLARSQGTISKLSWFIYGREGSLSTAIEGEPMGVSGTWSRVSQTVQIQGSDDSTDKTKPLGYDCRFILNWEGDGSVYFDDITLKEN